MAGFKILIIVLAGIVLKGEKTYCRNSLLDKMPKTVLGHNVEKNIQNL